MRELADNPGEYRKLAKRPEAPLQFDRSLEFMKHWLTIGYQDKVTYDTQIVTGDGDTADIKDIEKYVRDMNKLHGELVEFNVVNRDLGERGNGNNIAIDLRTGESLNYEPYDNPYSIDYPDIERSLNEQSLVWRVDDSLRRLERE